MEVVMKKSIIILIALLIAILLGGCNKDNGDANMPTEEPSDTATESEGETDGKSDEQIPDGSVIISTEKGCRIVYAEGCFDEASYIYGELMEIDPDAYNNIGYYTTAKAEKDYADDGKFQMLIGMTGRDASERSCDALETYLDYTIDVIDGKLVINSHSHERLREAVKYFISHLELIGEDVVYIPENKETLGKYTDYAVPNIDIAGVSLSDFSFVYPKDANEYELAAMEMMTDWIGKNTGAIIKKYDDSAQKAPYEILMGRTNRASSAQVFEPLAQNGYLFKVIATENGADIVISYANVITMNTLIEKIGSALSADGNVPDEIRGEIEEDKMIVSKIPQLRDPCILLENGVYYAYGTGWVCYKNTSGDLAGEWTSLGRVVDVPEDAKDCYWAPEVHKYNGLFYMFTTYKSEKSGHRGCTVLRSDSPEGPFVEISDGHVTPADWDSIDGTLYIDEEGQPWMIFVHEWTSMSDGIGRMAAAKMSDDLTHFVSEPIELFRADDPSWTDYYVTDGCWMYKCENGELIMIWSNFAPDGYCVGIARSDNGKVDGKWSQDGKLLYSKSMTGEYDGGHGMIFHSMNGQMYLSIHSPNSASDGRKETPVFIAIREENGTLVWDN
jgi:GH43 family beta-xylosidase